MAYDGSNAVSIAAKTKSKSFVIKSASASDDFIFWQVPSGITITKVSAKCDSGTNIIGQLQEYNGGGASPVDVDTGDWTVTTTEYEDSSFTNAAIDAGDWVGWKTASVSGTVNFFSVTLEYYEN